MYWEYHSEVAALEVAAQMYWEHLLVRTAAVTAQHSQIQRTDLVESHEMPPTHLRDCQVQLAQSWVPRMD